MWFCPDCKRPTRARKNYKKRFKQLFQNKKLIEFVYHPRWCQHCKQGLFIQQQRVWCDDKWTWDFDCPVPLATYAKADDADEEPPKIGSTAGEYTKRISKGVSLVS